MTTRADEVGELLELLNSLLFWIDDPDETIPVSVPLLRAIIKHLERVPLSQARPKRISGRDKVREATALALMRGRRQKLVDEGCSKVDAEWQAAEEGVKIFAKLTGRKLAPSTLRRKMQSAPRFRR